LKELELSSLTLFNDITAKGPVSCVLGDNLGLHGIGGFVESFSASHFCRFCMITRKEFDVPVHHVSETRTVESYQWDVKLAANGGHSCGVKVDSVLNSLLYFHVCAPGLPPCVGHDLFEGVIDADLFLYINHMVNKLKWLSFDYFNRIVVQFTYVGDDAANKPVPVNPQGGHLGGHAVQNWTMLRLLSLCISDKVNDHENEVWLLYLLLKQIVQLVCCKFITVLQIAHLHCLTEDYLHRRAAAFPEVNFRPKYHYLMHYASLTLKFDHLMHLWTSRFESKHSYFKRSVRYCQNFKKCVF
jgi:hypothetical protein